MLLFKIFGLLFIFSVCAVLGVLKSDSLKRRGERLQDILKSLSRLSELIRMGNYEMDELVSICFDSSVISVSCGKFRLKEEYLLKEDVTLLRDFFADFGMTDKESEYERTKFYYSLLKAQHSTALKVHSELGRLYRSIGFMGGLILCIFLM